jgi:hypothetical protein
VVGSVAGDQRQAAVRSQHGQRVKTAPEFWERQEAVLPHELVSCRHGRHLSRTGKQRG